MPFRPSAACCLRLCVACIACLALPQLYHECRSDELHSIAVCTGLASTADLVVCLQALCNVSKLPQNLRQQLFRPQPPQGATAQPSLDR